MTVVAGEPQCQEMVAGIQCRNKAYGKLDDIEFCRLHFSFNLATDIGKKPENLDPEKSADFNSLVSFIKSSKSGTMKKRPAKHEERKD